MGVVRAQHCPVVKTNSVVLPRKLHAANNKPKHAACPGYGMVYMRGKRKFGVKYDAQIPSLGTTL